MSGPDLDPVTAESELQDADFAGEHDRPSTAHDMEDRTGFDTDESVPDDRGGVGGGMDMRGEGSGPL